MDQTILARASWHADPINMLPTFGGRMRRWLTALQVRIFQPLCKLTTCFPVAELGLSRYLFPLLWRAICHRSDLYIGHYTGTLPVVAWAARLTGVSFAFDFEDFHRGEVSSDARLGRLIVAVENRYLSAAKFTTAASWGIAESVAETAGIRAPVTILNAFPWADRARLLAPKRDTPRDGLSMYWFSQIVSLDRGLQDIIRAMGVARASCSLAIRGTLTADVETELLALARRCGVERHIKFLPLIQPHDLLAAASEYDIGLCLEVPAIRSRDLCLPNKVFVYLLAGLAIVASRTRGHEDLFTRRPGIGFLYTSGDVDELARILDRLACNWEILEGAKAQALAAARECWNWETESKALVSSVHETCLVMTKPTPGRD